VIFDLHCHTDCSDGSLSPEALVLRAKDKGVSVLSITDHDTIASWQMAEAVALDLGIQLIPGIEFSSQWARGSIHIVGLNISTESPELLSAIDAQTSSREQRSLQIAEKLRKLGIENALEGARKFAGDAVLARPHFAQYLISMGYAKDMNAAFKKYLGQGKPADVKYEWPEMSQVIGWIKAAGGYAVLAHPAKYELTRTKLCQLVSQFAELGGDAIEVISGVQPKPMTDDLIRIANQYNLYASCGSDFHQPNQPWQELGSFGLLPEKAKPIWQLMGFDLSMQ
jgi:3',5'-nucleoside bisphosphate phosphatase